MKKLAMLSMLSIAVSCCCFAKNIDIILKKGSVLIYTVTEGKKSYQYTVTVLDWESKDKGPSFSWQTNEKPKPRKGIFTLPQYFSLDTDEFLVGVGKTGDEQVGAYATRLLVPALLNDYLLEEADDAEIEINENGKTSTLKISDAEVNSYKEKSVKYNGIPVVCQYALITDEKSKKEIGLFQEINDYHYFLAYYHSDALTMDLVSIKNNTGVVIPKTEIYSKLSLPPALESKPKIQDSKLSLPPALETKPKSVVMDATKLTAVKKLYPLLATVENYDVTNGGIEPKPFSETYEFRQGSGAVNPPSAIDCFTADLQILYNQRKNFDLLGMPENVSKKNLPSSSAIMLLNVYLKKEATNIPGYKPFTHWKFVRSLTETQRSQLAIELEGYIKKYGFTQ